MSEPFILRNDTDGVAAITLNSPKSLNALSDGMMAALQSQLDTLATDTTIRVVILRGAGKVFCAGHDLKEMTRGRAADDGGAGYFGDLFDRCGHLMQTISRIPQPVIAQVHGIATAAGCQLVATCDMAVAAQGTRFGVNGVNIGLFCSTPMVALTRNVPRKQAFEMLTTGDFISTERAAEVGLINHAVPHDDLETATMELAQKVSAKLGRVVSIGKRAFYEQINMNVADAYAYTGEVMAQNMMMADTKEGIDAFIEKRAPKWSIGG